MMCCGKVKQSKTPGSWDEAACGAYSVHHALAYLTNATDCSKWQSDVKNATYPKIKYDKGAFAQVGYSDPRKIVKLLGDKQVWVDGFYVMHEVSTDGDTKDFWSLAGAGTGYKIGDGLSLIKSDGTGKKVGICVCLAGQSLHYVAVVNKNGNSLEFCDPYDGKWKTIGASVGFKKAIGSSGLLYGGVCIVLRG